MFFAFLNRNFEQFFGQIFSRRVKALSNRNLVASRHIKRENPSLLKQELNSSRRLCVRNELKINSGKIKNIGITKDCRRKSALTEIITYNRIRIVISS